MCIHYYNCRGSKVSCMYHHPGEPVGSWCLLQHDWGMSIYSADCVSQLKRQPEALTLLYHWILMLDDHARTLENSSTYSWEPITAPRYGLPSGVTFTPDPANMLEASQTVLALSQARFWMDWGNIQRLDLLQLICSTMHATAQQSLWQQSHQHAAT